MKMNLSVQEKQFKLEQTFNKRIKAAQSFEEREQLYQEAYDGLFNYLLSADDSQTVETNTKGHLPGDVAYFKSFLQESQDILDIGCGFGGVSIYLAHNGFHVTAIDISGRLIDINKKKWAMEENVSFIQMSGCQLKFGDESFDGAFSCDMIEHLHPEDVRLHFRETSRVLKPRKRYVVMTPHALTGPHDSTRCVTDRSQGPQGGHQKEWSFRELSELALDSGFTKVFSTITYLPKLKLLTVPISVKIMVEKLAYQTSGTSRQWIIKNFRLDPLWIICVK